MIDTIKIAWPMMNCPDSRQLITLGWNPRYDEFSGELASWRIQEKGISGMPRLGLFKAPNGLHYCAIQVSLPALVRGSNTLLLTELEVLSALDSLKGIATGRLKQDFLPLSDASVWEIDFARDLTFGDRSAADFMKTLAVMDIKGFERTRYSDTTLYLHPKRCNPRYPPRTICIYAKQAERIAKNCSESDIELSKGVIRLEYRFRKSSAIKRLVKTLCLPDQRPLTIASSAIAVTVLNPVEEQMRRVISVSGELKSD
ncbi:MAG: hypothetical protein ABIO36_05905 [Pyrinomonadaceae bacterium]